MQPGDRIRRSCTCIVIIVHMCIYARVSVPCHDSTWATDGYPVTSQSPSLRPGWIDAIIQITCKVMTNLTHHTSSSAYHFNLLPTHRSETTDPFSVRYPATGYMQTLSYQPQEKAAAVYYLYVYLHDACTSSSCCRTPSLRCCSRVPTFLFVRVTLLSPAVTSLLVCCLKNDCPMINGLVSASRAS